jgi:hypothetical protein
MNMKNQSEHKAIDHVQQTPSVRVPVKRTQPPLGGRVPGSKNKLTLLREAVLSGQEEVILKHFPKIVEAICKKAEKGDMGAAKLILERMIAPKRDTVSQDEEARRAPINIVINGAASFKPLDSFASEGVVIDG